MKSPAEKNMHERAAALITPAAEGYANGPVSVASESVDLAEIIFSNGAYHAARAAFAVMDVRVTELLRVANREVERRRVAERTLKAYGLSPGDRPSD